MDWREWNQLIKHCVENSRLLWFPSKHDIMVYFFSPQMQSKTKYKGHVQRGIGMNYDFIFFMELGGIVHAPKQRS